MFSFTVPLVKGTITIVAKGNLFFFFFLFFGWGQGGGGVGVG